MSRPTGRVSAGLAGLAAVVLALTACGGSDDSAADTPAEAAEDGASGQAPDTPEASAGPEASPSPEAADVSGTVVVLAAASLTDVMAEIEADLESTYPDLDVEVSTGPSSGLVEQALSGAPADLLLTANESTMADAVDGGVASDPQVFATNTLVIAVPAGNDAGVTGLEDFADDALTIVLCEPQVPCGTAAGEVLELAGVEPVPDSLSVDVRSALSTVALDEADASLVYATDVISAGDDVEAIEFPEAEQAVVSYPVAVLNDAQNVPAAELVRDTVLGELGQRVLGDAGFGAP